MLSLQSCLSFSNSYVCMMSPAFSDTQTMLSWSNTSSRGIPPMYRKQRWHARTKSVAVYGRLCSSAYLYREWASTNAAAYTFVSSILDGEKHFYKKKIKEATDYEVINNLLLDTKDSIMSKIITSLSSIGNN